MINIVIRTKGKYRFPEPFVFVAVCYMSACACLCCWVATSNGSPPASPIKQVCKSLTRVMQFVTSGISHVGIIVTDDIPGPIPPS